MLPCRGRNKVGTKANLLPSKSDEGPQNVKGALDKYNIYLFYPIL